MLGVDDKAIGNLMLFYEKKKPSLCYYKTLFCTPIILIIFGLRRLVYFDAKYSITSFTKECMPSRLHIDLTEIQTKYNILAVRCR